MYCFTMLSLENHNAHHAVNRDIHTTTDSNKMMYRQTILKRLKI